MYLTRLILPVLLILFASSFGATAADEKKAYDETADAKLALAAAQNAAKTNGRRTLVVFGANWCPDCRVLDSEMQQGELAKLVARQLQVVKIDFGRFDRNKDVSALYGDILKKGIPSVVLLRPDGTALWQTNGGELADARLMGSDGLKKFFDEMLTRHSASNGRFATCV